MNPLYDLCNETDGYVFLSFSLQAIRQLFHYTRLSVLSSAGDFSIAFPASFPVPDLRTLYPPCIYRTKKVGSRPGVLLLHAKQVYAPDQAVTRDQQQAEDLQKSRLVVSGMGREIDIHQRLCCAVLPRTNTLLPS